MSSPSKEIRPLTSLRFFAALMVLFERVQMIPGTEWFHTATSWPGRMGVSLFFVLSGFILNYSYGGSNWDGAFGKTVRDYYVGRVARIYPLHWLMFVIALPLGLNSRTARVNLADLPSLFLLIDKLWPGFSAGSPPVKVAWTLSCEVIFYLLVPLILVFLLRRRRPLVASLGLLAGASAVIFTAAARWPALNWSGYIHMPEFLIGIVGFQWHRLGTMASRGNEVLFGGVAWLAEWALIEPRLPIPFSVYSDTFLGFAPGSMLVILGAASLRGDLKRFLSLPALVLLGNASYALYLLHDPFLRYCKVLLNRRDLVLPLSLDLLVTGLQLGICVAVSVALFWLFETPLRLKIRAIFSSRKIPVEMEASSFPSP